jgi:hypothetical protein
VVGGGLVVSILYLSDTEHAQGLEVVSGLLSLELFNGNFSVVNSEEVDQLFVVFDLSGGRLNSSLQVKRVTFFGGLRLPEVLE